MKRKVLTPPFHNSQQIPNDGVYDWMDESLGHNPAVLPKHCIDSSGHLRRDLLRPAPLNLLRPAPLSYRVNRLVAGERRGGAMRNRRGGSEQRGGDADAVEFVAFVGLGEA